MKFSIDTRVFNQFPGLQIGTVVAWNLNNQQTDEKIFHLLEEVENLIKTDFTSETIGTHERITSRKAAVGPGPQQHTSLEVLMKAIMEQGALTRASALVNLYRYVSLKRLIPIGAADLHETIGDITVAPATGTELFVSAEGDSGKESPKKGEIISHDRVQVHHRHWNTEESYKTRITEKTGNAILYVEGLPPVTPQEVQDATTELKDLIESFLGGNCSTYILSKERPSIEF